MNACLAVARDAAVVTYKGPVFCTVHSGVSMDKKTMDKKRNGTVYRSVQSNGSVSWGVRSGRCSFDITFLFMRRPFLCTLGV